MIVKLSDESLASYEGGVQGIPATSPEVTGAPKLDATSAASQMYLSYLEKQEDTFVSTVKSKLPSVQVTHSYKAIIGGVAMLVPADQVDLISSMPGVEAVYPDTLQQLDTDRTPQFINATSLWGQLGGQDKAGENVVVGVLDTGIWPEHPSFSDPDPSSKSYGAAPSTWHGIACEFGSAVSGDAPFTCNGKLIGAQRFMATYDFLVGTTPEEFLSARDDDGHGTHTASTAAGNGNVEASIFGVSRGIISGIAPRARVAAYKVCGIEGCYGSDSAAAVEQAVLDGVNVINFSISGGSNPYADAVSLAFLDAYSAGVFVAASAGNSGPALDTTDHREPWVTTVAASTADRAFQTTATIVAGSNSTAVSGASLTQGIVATPIVDAAAAPYSDSLCLNSTPDNVFAGKVVICKRGTNGRAEKGFNVQQRGAVGMILYNQATNVTDLETDNHYLPAVHIQFADGQTLVAFVAANPGATATWPAGSVATQQGDVMASFSSRGGPGQSLGVNKPDITAPGVQILAGASPQHVDIASGPQGELFQAIAGTSMSSPHIAGSGALMKALHPNWTPGQIKSALMMTAKTNVVKEDGVTPADPFDDGAGRVDLGAAAKAIFTIDETAANYLALQDELWNANYPSLYVPVMPGSITVKRTVRNNTSKKYNLTVHVSAPSDVTIIVPKELRVPANGTASFYITILAPNVPLGEARHATINFKKDNAQFHFPISFVRDEPMVTLAKTCDPASLPKGAVTTCTITATNNSFDAANVSIADVLPSHLKLIKSSVVGATASGNSVSFNGTLAGAEPPDVTIAEGTSPGGGYLPLSLFGMTPVSGVSDDSIINFNVPAFLYGGQVYTRIGVGSNGYVVIGGGSGSDVSINNQNFPDPTRPNNVLAAFWTDLNPAAAGAIRVGTLTDGADTWIVVDWEAVREFSQPRLASFQMWIGVNSDMHPAEDISFAYGLIQGNGDGGFLSVGAENVYGNRGQNYYYNGTGTLPAASTQLRVSTAAPQPGESHVITLRATGEKKGTWQNCAMMNSDAYQGTNIACFTGEGTKK
ncbi:MAG: S8 family serine peptidase [Chloroflexi bacterium]|nr:S8 family serine peptidase [Chloroflexota bacterium]